MVAAPPPPPPCNATDMNLMMNPIIPMAAMPRRHILMESQSSSLPGFLASFSSLETAPKNDLNPKAKPPKDYSCNGFLTVALVIS